eukprot:1668667-Prymnesium_polylepis.1
MLRLRPSSTPSAAPPPYPLRRHPAGVRHLRPDRDRQPQQGYVRVPRLQEQDAHLAGLHPVRVQAPLPGADGDADRPAHDDVRLGDVMPQRIDLPTRTHRARIERAGRIESGGRGARSRRAHRVPRGR